MIKIKLLLLLNLIFISQETSISDVIYLACQRNPSLSVCQNSTSTTQSDIRRHQSNNHHNRTFASVTENEPSPTEDDKEKLDTIQIRHEDVELLRSLLDRLHKEHDEGKPREGDLREHTGIIGGEEEHERINWRESSNRSRKTHEGEGDIFGDFDDHSESGSDSTQHKSQSQVETYCNTYQENYAFYCLGGINERSHLREHLRKFCPSFEVNCPEKVAKYSKPSTLSSIQEHKTSVTGTEVNPFPNVAAIAEESESPELKALKQQHPCKPDCDPRIWKHCTKECKCDWIYPYVQRFCNPPPMPLFLNTCRLWYYSCPKYERYNYASQFVYSKAEKGKVLPGAPVGSRWPSGVAPYSNVVAQPFPIFQPQTTGTAPGPGSHNSPEGLTAGVNNPFLKKDFIENAQPQSRDDLSRQVLQNKKRAKAFQAQSFPVVPSDSAFAAGNVPASTGGFAAGDVHQFDAYTDRRGVLHRPRSRSPFTKPGLWEPNPDDPHNRDHANKFYYEPKSVGVDWLNGQINYGGHWAVPAAGVGGTNGYSAIFFPSIGNFLNIADDYD